MQKENFVSQIFFKGEIVRKNTFKVAQSLSMVSAIELRFTTKAGTMEKELTFHWWGFVYVFGGVTGKNLNYKNDRQGNERGVYHDGEDNVGLLSLCEKYDVSDDQWYEISETPYSIKNAGACALSSDSIFLFGG